MPRGRRFCGSRTSSALVATTSKPMKAKNTSEAADSMPKMPYCAGAAPVSHENSDCVQASDAPPSVGTASGMNGTKFAALMKKKPTTMTKTTIATLMMVNTMPTRDVSFVPATSRAVNSATMRNAGQLTSRPAISTVAGNGMPNASSASPR